MRSKNVVPLQVVSSSELMGNSQSVPKATFEEALHNSIESSLRSAAVVPSSVFSSLFFGLQQHESSTSITNDVKPSTAQLSAEVNKHTTYVQDGSENPSGLHDKPVPLQHLSPPVSRHPSSSKSAEGPPALLPASHVRRHSGVNEHALKTDNPSVIQAQALPLLTQQQQLELQKLKHLHRVQAWQKIQKNQSSNSQASVGGTAVACTLPTSSAQQLAMQSVLPSVNNIRLPPTAPANGVYSNGASHPTLYPLESRSERKPMLHGQVLQGFCKAGKDIRLATYENSASSLAAYPVSYALLAVQTKPSSSDSNGLVIIALNLKSLPPPNTSAQALSAQCVGCGESALHTFGQLSDHVGLDAVVDLTSPRLTSNSSQLLGIHARFYLVKDLKNPNRLIRGPSMAWNKPPDVQGHTALGSPRFAIMPNLNSPLHSRTNVPSYPTPVQLPSVPQKDAPQHVASRDERIYPHTSVPSTAGSMPRRNPAELAKPLTSAGSKDGSAGAQGQLVPKRYMLSHDPSSASSVEVPQDFASNVQRKPVVALMCSTGDLPRFAGDTSSITVTSFTDCFRQPSIDASKDLDQSLLVNDILLLASLHYVVSLGAHGNFCKEGLSQALFSAWRTLFDAFLQSLKFLGQNGFVSLLNLIASTSGGRVAIVVSEFSIADALSRCLTNVVSKPDQMYQFAVQTSASSKDVQFHLVVSSASVCRRIGESLLSPSDRAQTLKQSLVSLQFTQLSLALAGPSNDHRVSSYATSNHAPFVAHENFYHTSNLVSSVCPRIDGFRSEMACALLDKIIALPDFDLSRFTSLRFVFLLPPSTAAYAQTVNAIAISGIFSDVFKSSLPGSAFASQVVITSDESSQQRLLSICKQWENSSTLLLLVELDAHMPSCRSANCDLLNHKSITDASNVVVIQSSSSPYPLLTNRSRVPTSNEVYACPYVCQADANNRITSMYFSTSTTCSICFSIVYDPQYEYAKRQLLKNNFMLHTSLVACELLIQQYTSSLLVATARVACQHTLRNRYRRFLSPVINQVVEELLSSSKAGKGSMVIVRAHSSILAEKFYDTLIQTRDKLNLCQVFEIVRYSDIRSWISVSHHFLEILKASNWSNPDWKPSALLDLAGIPCIVVYEGAGVVPQMLPSSLKYVDLRLAFEGVGLVHRTLLEQELSLAYPVCTPPDNHRTSTSPPRKRMKHSSDTDDDAMQIVVSAENSGPSEDGSTEDNASSSVWRGQRNARNETSAQENKKTRSPFESKFDFVSIAMKEADLASECKVGKAPEDDNTHCSPSVILPMNIHQILEGEQEGHSTISALSPHPLCDWAEPLHPIPSADMSSTETSQFYRKWSKPMSGHPDYVNNEGAASGQRRFLLVTPPCAGAVQICCKFLRQLHSHLMKMHEVKVYSDQDNFEEIGCGSTFRALLPNPWHKNQSQIENSCNDLDKLGDCLNAGMLRARVVETRISDNSSACPVRQPAWADTEEIPQSSLSDVQHEQHSLVLSSSEYKGGLHVQLLIPRKHVSRFAFQCKPGSELQLPTFRLKTTSEPGIKTPVVSLACHGIRDGVFNLRSTLSLSPDDSSKDDPAMHMIVVKKKDAESFQKYCPGSSLIVLPEELDYLGRGAMKFVTQLIFTLFYETESKRNRDSGDDVWPFVLLLDDDCVSWSSWQPPDSSDSFRNSNENWSNFSLAEVLQNVEATIGDEVGVVGFRPWADVMKDPDALEHVQTIENKETEQGNYVSERCVESCIMVNLNKTKSVKYKHTRFYNEDIDWTLRVAAAGVRVCRFENIALARKVLEPIADEALLTDGTKTLMIAADSDFDPLPYHPNQLLESYFIRSASEIFSRARNKPRHPVLCLDCYVSLGVEIFVEYSSSGVDAPSWTVDHSKEYGGLMLFCPNSELNPEFLRGFKFIEAAAVCLIGNDRSSLRQSVVKLSLETDWHFRLTDEFQTANSEMLGGSRFRPLYFLTGLRKMT